MDLVITPEPHYIPGYTGHCPQFRFRAGKTYGKLTHKLLIDPCVIHAPELIVTPSNRAPISLVYPTTLETELLNRREKYVDPVYRNPIIPGYDGFVPNLASKVGKRYIAAATAGMAEHELLMDQLRCQRRNLMHRDLLGSGFGVFENKMNERMLPYTHYRSPLMTVNARAKAFKKLDCNFVEKKEPYSKSTVPHFMENDDEEKYIVNGYGGHIPMALTRFGETSKQLTNSALCEFTNNYHHRRSAEWCPQENAGIGSSCPNTGHFVIYHRTIGMVPKYAGHVPGETFTFGRTFGDATVDAKHWLALHKD
ncbi:CIMIP2 protein GA14893 [Bactrocera oleae]|uniref:CIMIP2 protein GA14893 n=1 Tax=Bactrocera oleae TaxID=104688 RepID=UPI0006B6B119|nr:UPF0605 protein GA14893 [Bactrocera oleae]